MAETLLSLVQSIVPSFDPGMPPPPVAPVPDGVVRPRWSVMIPTFNCAQYLRTTLESVLAQAPGSDEMQIEVVDDVSTKDDPEAVVREVGRGRVLFHRKAQNEGVCRNFNTCLERSRGHLVQILHGDDYVLPGFYARVTAIADQQCDTAAFFTRCRVVNENAGLEEISKRLRRLAAPTRAANELYYENPIRTPGVVIRRSFYEQHGGFFLSLVHVADWEMWARATQYGGALWLNELLADYRHFSGNDTSRLVRSAEDVRDRLRLAQIFARRFPDFDFDRVVRDLSRSLRRRMQDFQLRADAEAAAANSALYHLLTNEARRALHERWDAEIGGAAVEGPARLRALLNATRSARAAGRSLYIWGAGQAGQGCLQQLRVGGLTVDGFVDSDARKNGSRVQELPIVGPAQLSGADVRPYVLIASMYAADIARTLQGLGFAEEKDFFVA